MREEDLEEFMTQARKAKKEDLELADAMKRLMANRDYGLFMMRILGPKIEEAGALLLNPSKSVDGMVASEFIKGAMFAFCLTRDMPNLIIKAMDEMNRPRGDDQ